MVQAAGQEHYTGAEAARFMEEQGGMFGGSISAPQETVGKFNAANRDAAQRGSAEFTFKPGAETVEVSVNQKTADRIGVKAEGKAVSNPAVNPDDVKRAASVASSSSVREAIAASRGAVRGVGGAQGAPTPTPKASGVEKKSNGRG